MGTDTCSSPKKKRYKPDKVARLTKPDQKFGGLTEEDVMKMFLPDHLRSDLDIVFVGINPGLRSAYIGHHYAGKNNHFWWLMYNSGLIPEPFDHKDDFKCLEYGIGMTNVVARTTRAASDLTKQEMRDGKQALIQWIQRNRPKIIAFNGKGIYQTIFGGKCEVGVQKDCIEETDACVYVMPSTSGLVAQYPRKQDKLIF